MGDAGSVRYCGSCGGELPGDAQFCAHCGAAQDPVDASALPQVDGSDGQASGEIAGPTGPPKRTGLKILVGGVLVALLVGGAAVVVSLASGGGSSDMALVFEPGSDGYGDVFVVGALGDPYDREDRVLSDVALEGEFREALSATTWVDRQQTDFEVDGGRLVAYREEGDDDVTVGVVDIDGREVVPLADGSYVTVRKALSGDVFARFSGDRCAVYRLGGVDDIERLGRGTRCEVGSSGVVVIVDSRSTKSDITVFRPDGTTTEFDTRDTASQVRVSPNGALVALVITDADLAEPIEFQLFDTVTGDLLSEMRTPGAYSLWIGSVLDSGALVTVSETGGGQELHSLTPDGTEWLAEGDQVHVQADPSGSRAFVRVADWEGEIGEYSIWDGSTGELGEAVEADLNTENPFGWADVETAIFVDTDGGIVGVDREGAESDLGDVGDDSGYGWMRLHDGGLLSIHTTSPDLEESLAIIPAGSGRVVNVIGGRHSIGIQYVSTDGQMLAVAVLEDSDVDDQILYVFDVAAEELIEVDEDYIIVRAALEGETVAYSALMSGGEDGADVETRRFDLESRTRSDVVYEGTITFVPRSSVP